MTQRRKNKYLGIVFSFMILLAIAWAFLQAGLPFGQEKENNYLGVSRLEDEITYKWDDAKRSNYNAKFNIILEVNNLDAIADSLNYLVDYVEDYKGAIISKNEYIVRVPVSESKSFSRRIRDIAQVTTFSSDYSTSLNSGTLDTYNDSLVVLQAQRKSYEDLRRENPNIKGYDKDIEEIDVQINRIESLKLSLRNKDYDLFLIAFSERLRSSISSTKYLRLLVLNFIYAFITLAILFPLLFIGAKLIFKLSSIFAYSSSDSKSKSLGNYGYNYGRKRQVKRIYKDKPKGEDVRRTDKSNNKNSSNH